MRSCPRNDERITHLKGEITKLKGKGKGDEKGEGKLHKLLYIWVQKHLNLVLLKI